MRPQQNNHTRHYCVHPTPLPQLTDSRDSPPSLSPPHSPVPWCVGFPWCWFFVVQLLEVFGTGTAAVISPVNGIKYREHDIEVPSGDCIGPLAKRFWETLTDIQYGRVEHPWSVQIS
ncbi:C-terminal fragment branched chain amino acid aminotransferase BACT3 [Ectocarpus siliculosus]|uniref:C-terminal branched chain amino acid aminotransferase BACT3 n=1 Tax=Ectocarpus siliculosus TaxID=2880 RepID=D8LT78_ECTSI|nr:C-terminal fragment branched chain amino acid aminotransferase BACT3 [Ectocarpus siliculosus]